MAQTTAIKFLFLDIGGVLLSDGWTLDARERAATRFNIDFRDFEDRHQALWDMHQQDKCTLDDYLAHAVFHRPRPFTTEQFRQFILAQSKPNPAMLELAHRLKAKYDLKVVAVSNEGRELNAQRIAQFKLNEIFDAYASSCFVHLLKPDPGIFRLALDIVQATAVRTVYVENTAMFVEVAAAMGIHSVLHRDIEATRVELASIGLV